MKQLVIFHHEPDHDDAFMEKLEAEAQAEWSGALAAREGMLLEAADRFYWFAGWFSFEPVSWPPCSGGGPSENAPASIASIALRLK